MKITRKILGKSVEIEITYEEKRRAYIEMKREYDIEDIKTRLEDMVEEGDELAQKILDNEEMISALADKLRENLDEDDHISECLWNTIDDLIENMKEGF